MDGLSTVTVGAVSLLLMVPVVDSTPEETAFTRLDIVNVNVSFDS